MRFVSIAALGSNPIWIVRGPGIVRAFLLSGTARVGTPVAQGRADLLKEFQTKGFGETVMGQSRDPKLD